MGCFNPQYTKSDIEGAHASASDQVRIGSDKKKTQVERTRHAVHLFRTGKLASIGHKSQNISCPPDIPSREESYSRNTVDPGKVKGRKNRAAMLHALANIEQWA
jgi:uncharacterized ferritin-like protein (DUF455 family)